MAAISTDPDIPLINEIRADYIREHTRTFDGGHPDRTLTSEQEFYGNRFDRAIARARAEALRDAAAATRNEAPDEPYAGATFDAHANYLEECAALIEKEAVNDG